MGYLSSQVNSARREKLNEAAGRAKPSPGRNTPRPGVSLFYTCYTQKMESSPQNQESLPITLERATSADLEAFMELEKSVRNPKTYPSSANEEEALAELTNTQVYFIKKEDHVVGNISYEMNAEDHAEITGLMVDPHYQGQGIGREALTAILDKLKGVKRIDLVTHPENEQALPLYQSLGFHIESRVEDYYGDGQPRLILVKAN